MTPMPSMEIKEKIANSNKIDLLMFTRMGSIIISKRSIMYAVDICGISEFLGISISSRVVWENITNRFILFNIPVNISLAGIGQEISEYNNTI